MTLDALARGVPARITAIDWAVLAEDEGKRLRALGLDLGAEVEVAHRGVFAGRDPLAVRVGSMTIALRRVHAAAMQVKAL
ncbi:MAG: ferrous iron transport protein A [Sphingomonadaceae bacterium]